MFSKSIGERNRSWYTIIAVLIVASSTQRAECHVTITSHETRLGMQSIETGPCGRYQSERGDIIHVFEAGETIQLEWNEFVAHPGYFRISFDEDGDDSFVDPAAYYDFHTNESVLVDNLFPHEEKDPFGFTYEYELTLPDVECEDCTLQLIQVMTDKAPYTSPGDDIYYNCLDVRLVAAVPEPSGWMPLAIGMMGALLVRARRTSVI